MISDLLPRYFEVTEINSTYTILRSIVVNNHEVGWVEVTGTTEWNIIGQGPEEESYTFRSLVCECNFTEGLGYGVNGIPHCSRHGYKEACLPRQAAVHLRHLELRQEYLQRFRKTFSWELSSHVKEIILDLIQKAKNGEFLGSDSSAANLWGGYFYLGTVASITDQPVGDMWAPARELHAEKKIYLDGAVVQEYTELPPEWSESFRVEMDGFVAIASLPAHDRMPQEWRFEVTKPDGSPAFKSIQGLALTHSSDFGPDIEDVDRAEQKIRRLLTSAKKKGKTK